jgi:hypothetical protein
MIIQNWQNKTVLKATIKKENKTNGTCLIKKKKRSKELDGLLPNQHSIYNSQQDFPTVHSWDWVSNF